MINLFYIERIRKSPQKRQLSLCLKYFLYKIKGKKDIRAKISIHLELKHEVMNIFISEEHQVNRYSNEDTTVLGESGATEMPNHRQRS